ncbi:hypothetical protein F5887DRAFT_1063413 [Amanita rubescens]|nr:hypothetical protein F5887DRAFT_1063413 [Amanita rubescens]
MAIHPTLLTSGKPTAVAAADAHITHVQLRDLILCPREPGIVNYIHDQGIVEHDLHAPPGTPPRIIAAPEFHPNTLAALRIPDTNDILYAAGGQEADLHFSYHTFSKHLENCSINNSVVLTNSLGLAYSNESSVEPRVIVSNNDFTIKLFDVPLRTTGSKHTRNLKEVGSLKLTVPVNHTSLSPDSRTVLSVGDSSEVFLHHVSGGLPFWLPPNALAASFSTAFSADGAKFAVASQEGVVAVWDVRSTKPMKVFQTNKTTGLGPAAAGWSNSAASGWLFEDVHFHGGGAGTVRPPGWSVRSVKFGGGIGGSGREVLAFTEHSNLMHVVDAKTFETEEIVRVPVARGPALTPAPLTPAATGTRPSSTRTASESSLTSGSRSRPSGLPSVDYRDRELRDIQERRVQRAREIVARRLGRRDSGDGTDSASTSARAGTGYSPPSSIGDSTWRTLRTAGDDRGSGRNSSGLSQFSRVLRGRGDGDREEEREEEREEDEAALLLIPALVEGIEARDVEDILSRHGILVNDRRRSGSDDNRDNREDADGEEDRNTGSAVADFDYPYEFGDSNVWRSTDEGRHEDMTLDGQPQSSRSGGPGFNWITGREEDDEDEQEEKEKEQEDTTATTSAELDLAGVCFDPSGSRLYVASTKSVAEWHVRGSEKRWWSGDDWA